MSRRLVSLTLDTLEDLPRSCRQCVYWELDPLSAERACAAGDPALEKEAWVSQALLEWGSCGKLVYVDGLPAGFVMYAPPAYVPRSMAFPTSPVSADAVLLMTARVVPAFAGGGLGRMLVQGVARDLTKRGIKAIEAFGNAVAGDTATGEAAASEAPRLDVGRDTGGCLVPADFFLSVGFKTVRQHSRYPRLRLELRTALAWKSDVEYALEKLLGSMSAEHLLRPVRPVTRSISR
ncbi:MAG TPA: GNAT family N-acetyltransferase [Micromonosporaceae bacterium]|nr:GNAT family N-acetyltransferase [Micromonosporaceae bacterium]